MMHCCLPGILWGVLPCHSSRLLYRICTMQISFQHHFISLSSCNNNQPPYGPFFHSCCILCWIKVFCYSCFCLFLFSFPQKSDALWPYLTHLLHVPLKKSLLFFSFLRILVIENSLWGFVSLFSCFRPIISSRTNEFISCVPCMPSLRCWYYNIISQVYKLRLGNQKLVPSYNIHISHILP